MTLRNLAIAAALGCACMLQARGASAQQQGEFEKGRAAYATKNYADADRRFRAMLDPETGVVRDPALVTEARMYWAASLFALDRKPEAAVLIEKLLLAMPEYEPDPLRFPQDFINFFIDTRTAIIDKINAAKAAAAKAAKEAHDKEVADRVRFEKRLALLESMASQEIAIERHSRLFALLPFGAGQFQNGHSVLGWGFLGTEAGLFAAASITFPVYRIQLNNASDAFAQGQRTQADQWLSRATATRTANLVLWGAFAATAIAGVVQAELAFVPETTETRQRAIPTVTYLSPFFAPLIPQPELGARWSGGIAGIQGVF